MRKVLGVLLAVPLTASMLLTACGGDTKPTASASSTTISSPTTTSAPTPSASPSTTATRATDPNIPAAARAHTPAGAEAFTRYFFQRMNVAWTAPKAGILSPLCQPSAIACIGFERDATRLTKDGHRYDGNPVTIEYIGTLDATNPKKYDVLANVVQERRSEIDATGKTVITDKRKNLRFHFELDYTHDSWSVASLKLMK